MEAFQEGRTFLSPCCKLGLLLGVDESTSAVALQFAGLLRLKACISSCSKHAQKVCIQLDIKRSDAKRERRVFPEVVDGGLKRGCF